MNRDTCKRRGASFPHSRFHAVIGMPIPARCSDDSRTIACYFAAQSEELPNRMRTVMREEPYQTGRVRANLANHVESTVRSTSVESEAVVCRTIFDVGRVLAGGSMAWHNVFPKTKIAVVLLHHMHYDAKSTKPSCLTSFERFSEGLLIHVARLVDRLGDHAPAAPY